MQKARNTTIIILIFIVSYFLFSQFYLKSFGNAYTYVINPIFFVLMAIVMKFFINSLYKTTVYQKDIIFYVLITACAYGIIELVSGLFLTYGNNPYANTFKGVLLNLYSTGIIIICIEYIRFKLINNVYKKDKNLIFVLIVITFALKDIPIYQFIHGIGTYVIFKTIFTTILPSIIKNILFTYIAMYTDYKPGIIYQLILYLMLWIPPILPNAPWIYNSVIEILFPLILLLYCIYDVSARDKYHLYRYLHPIKPRGVIPLTICVVLAIWFAIGIFPIRPLGIATGSMKPTLNVGDLVFIKKCNANSIEVNDVIEYKRQNYSVIHRVVSKYQKDGVFYFITKGDNNSNNDTDPVREEYLKGKVVGRIPYLAMPTIWIDNLGGRQVNVDVETGN